MKRLLLAALLAAPAFAQDLNTITQTSYGFLAAQDSGNCGATSCVWLTGPVGTSSVVFQLSGTFVATVTFEASATGAVWSSIGTGSTAGSYPFSLSGQRFVRARATAYTSGTARVDVAALVGPSAGGGFSWSGSQTQASNLTLNSAGFNSTFNSNSPTLWTVANTAASTSGTQQQSSPQFCLGGSYWNGSASTADAWCIQNSTSPANGGGSLMFTTSGHGKYLDGSNGGQGGFKAGNFVGYTWVSGPSLFGQASNFIESNGGGQSSFWGATNAPALSSCGTSPVVASGSNNLSGTITEGTSATGCTITFDSAYGAAPNCAVTSEAGLVFTYSLSASAITITNTGALSSTKLDYVCFGH